MSDFHWPAGVQAAAAFTFDVDAESAILSFAPQAAERLSVMSHQSYGPLHGVPRILRILDRHDIRSTFFVPGYTADKYPNVVRAIADAGHEIAHHGYLHETVTGMTEAEERRAIERGLEALERITGVRPVGYRAPMWEMNYRTPELLGEYGFGYDSSLFDSDLPYPIAIGDRDPLIEIPIQWSLDDWEQYAYLPDLTGTGLIETPTKAAELWRLELDAVYAERLTFVLTNHPFLSGRPSRAAALEGLIEYATALDGLWITTLGELADYTASLGLAPIRHQPPVLPD
jgi:peptidoglycan/xylan/chitin deacetylase (PgdA/CDA1 family)